METTTIMQHVIDLDRVVTLIEDKYAPNSLFLFGHSWGGGLLIEYLGGEVADQTKFNGWIDEDGSLQDKWEMDLKREWQIPRAQVKYDETVMKNGSKLLSGGKTTPIRMKEIGILTFLPVDWMHMSMILMLPMP